MNKTMITIKLTNKKIKELMEINSPYFIVPPKMKLVDIKYKFISYYKNGSIKTIFYETNHHMYYVKHLGGK